jgi:predicted MPP superfamily phosphohydrolase
VRRRFFLGLYGATAVFQIPFVVALAELLRARGLGDAARWGLAVAAGAAVVVALRWRIRIAAHDRHVGRARAWLIEEPYYVHWAACVLAAFLFVVGLVASGIAAALSLAAWPGVGAIAIAAYLAALPVAAWSVVVRRRWVRVREVVAPVVDLPASLEGLRIAQLSDLHIGAMTPARRGLRWAARANEVGADLIALTGDYVTSGVTFHDDIAEVCGALKAPLGVFAVPGNHDYFGDGVPLFDRMRARGVHVLRNEHVVLERGGATFVLAGVDDTWTRRADVEATMDAVGSRRPVVALAHDPKLFAALARRGAAVVLSGHTHWGQVALPFLPTRVNLGRIAYELHSGEHRSGEATLVISPGLGTTGPPLRLGAPPEITVVRLTRAS